MNDVELQKHLFKVLQKELSGLGFSKRGEDSFIRPFPEGLHSIDVAFYTGAPKCFYDVIISIRHNDAARISQTINNTPKRFWDDTVTTITQREYFYDTLEQRDIDLPDTFVISSTDDIEVVAKLQNRI